MQAWSAWDQVDIVPLPAGGAGLQLSNIRHTLFDCTCSCRHVTRAIPYRSGDDCQWHRTDVVEWRLVGPALAAMIVMLALRMRLSRARIQEFLDEFLGLSLSTGAIDQTIRESGRASQPLEDELVAAIEQAPLLHIDETPWKELGCLLWLWTLVSGTTVLFNIGHRNSEIINNPRFLSWTGASVHFSGSLARRDDDADCIPLGEATTPEGRKSVQSRL